MGRKGERSGKMRVIQIDDDEYSGGTIEERMIEKQTDGSLDVCCE